MLFRNDYQEFEHIVRHSRKIDVRAKLIAPEADCSPLITQDIVRWKYTSVVLTIKTSALRKMKENDD
jgi:hypothetical protein